MRDPPEDLVQAEPGTDRERTEDVLADRRERAANMNLQSADNVRIILESYTEGRGRSF